MWSSYSLDNRLKALKMANRLINGMNFAGEKADPEQVWQFPRGRDTEISQAIQDACCELALSFLRRGASTFDVRMKRQKTGDAETEYDTKFISESYVIFGIDSPKALALLKPYLRDPNIIDLDRS